MDTCRQDGWTVAPGRALPQHPRLAYYVDARSPMSKHPPSLGATIDGKSVPVKLTYVAAGPYELVQIEVDSARLGVLELAWRPSAARTRARVSEPTARYVIAKTGQAVSEVTGTPSRYHHAHFHTTVHESEDGVAAPSWCRRRRAMRRRRGSASSGAWRMFRCRCSSMGSISN